MLWLVPKLVDLVLLADLSCAPGLAAVGSADEGELWVGPHGAAVGTVGAATSFCRAHVPGFRCSFLFGFPQLPALPPSPHPPITWFRRPGSADPHAPPVPCRPGAAVQCAPHRPCPHHGPGLRVATSHPTLGGHRSAGEAGDLEATSCMFCRAGEGIALQVQLA